MNEKKTNITWNKDFYFYSVYEWDQYSEENVIIVLDNNNEYGGGAYKKILLRKKYQISIKKRETAVRLFLMLNIQFTRNSGLLNISSGATPGFNNSRIL